MQSYTEFRISCFITQNFSFIFFFKWISSTCRAFFILFWNISTLRITISIKICSLWFWFNSTLKIKNINSKLSESLHDWLCMFQAKAFLKILLYNPKKIVIILHWFLKDHYMYLIDFTITFLLFKHPYKLLDLDLFSFPISILYLLLFF